MDENSNKLTGWVQEYTDALYAWAYAKTNNVEVARDLVQETFLAAHKSLAKFQEKSKPKTWLFSILKNKIADYYRKKFKDVVVSESTIAGSESGNILEEVFSNDGKWVSSSTPGVWEADEIELLDDHNFKKVLKECMGRLNQKHFLAIQYKYLEEKDGKDICKELDISPTNFWQILHRSKLQLRNCLEQNWFNN